MKRVVKIITSLVEEVEIEGPDDGDEYYEYIVELDHAGVLNNLARDHGLNQTDREWDVVT